MEVRKTLATNLVGRKARCTLGMEDAALAAAIIARKNTGFWEHLGCEGEIVLVRIDKDGCPKATLSFTPSPFLSTFPNAPRPELGALHEFYVNHLRIL